MIFVRTRPVLHAKAVLNGNDEAAAGFQVLLTLREKIMVWVGRVRERPSVLEHTNQRNDIVFPFERQIIEIPDMDDKIRKVPVPPRRNLCAAWRNLHSIDMPSTTTERPRHRAAATADFEHILIPRERQPRKEILTLFGK